MLQLLSTFRGGLAIGALALLVAACGDLPVEPPPPPTPGDAHDQWTRERFGTVWGDEDSTILSFGRSRDSAGEGVGGGGIGVNAYLWQGTLDTIDFIPLASADPFGGLIITDWYQSVETPGERLKLNVQIRDATLRADAVKVTVFRQVRDAAGDWLDAPVDAGTARKLEDHILTRARELRIASAEAG